jgi:hypothetical protein
MPNIGACSLISKGSVRYIFFIHVGNDTDKYKGGGLLRKIKIK